MRASIGWTRNSRKLPVRIVTTNSQRLPASAVGADEEARVAMLVCYVPFGLRFDKLRANG